MVRYHLGIALMFFILFLGACGGDTPASHPGPGMEQPAIGPQGGAAGGQWPDMFPADVQQPWERLDGDGYVIPSSIRRNPSALDQASEFVPGVERFLEGGTATDNGEATHLSSTTGKLSYAIYRVPLGGAKPGVVSVDANTTAGDGYFVGLADYESGAWEWHGQFADNHIRLSTAGDTATGDYTSPLGSVFVCVVVFGGAGCDVIGIGINPADAGDSAAPPRPGTPVLTPVNGGLLMEWLPAVAGDLAGYRLYYCSQWFLDRQGLGVKSEDSLDGLTRHVLGGLEAKTYVRVSAVDMSGNESALSEIVSATPLSAGPPPMQVAVSAPSGMLGDAISITAKGAESYDFDTDGDGVYEITGDTQGIASTDTGSLGIIRAGVRGTSGSGTSVALGGVSVIIAGNSRPVASASVAPASGDAPLNVVFTGGDSADFDGEVVGGGWDFDGDGTFDVWDNSNLVHVTSSNHVYGVPGVYNAKLRVIDDMGAWDVDTVAVVVSGSGSANNPPVASLLGGPLSGTAPLTVNFDASGSNAGGDPGDSIVEYSWDWDGDGVYDGTTYTSAVTHTFTSAGSPQVWLSVEDSHGARATDTLTITVTALGNNPPVGSLLPADSSGDIPLTVNFDASGSTAGGDPGDTIVKYEWDMDGDGAYEAYGEDPDHAYTYASPGAFSAVVRVTDTAGNQDTATATVNANVPGNNPPTAAIMAFPSTGQTPLDVDFDASGSSAGGDPGDSIVRFDWDFDGDGHYEVYDGGAQPATHTFTLPGTHYIALRVTDSFGAQATQSTGITAYSWSSSTLDSQGSVGQYSSMELVNGNPAIAYYDLSGFDLKYMRASNPQGTAWDAPVTVVSNGDSGRYCSLAVVNGNPAISYWYASNETLRFVRANDTSGTSWGASVVVDPTTGTGRFSSLAMGSGVPMVAYYYLTGGDLKFAYADDGIGSTWSQIFTVDSANNSGQFCSLAIVSGNPAISYYEATNGMLMYTRAIDAAGSNWSGTKVIVDPVDDVGLYTSMTIVSDRPAISYFDQTNGDLRFVRATNSTGATWGVSVLVDSVNVTGRDTSLAVINGNPAISYYSFTNGDLMYARATNPIGTGWGTPVAVDSLNTTGEYTSLIELYGQPAISYCYSSFVDLRFASGSY